MSILVNKLILQVMYTSYVVRKTSYLILMYEAVMRAYN